MIDTLQTDNLRTWLDLAALDSGATANQRERWSAGLLPDSELAFLARKVLFAPLEGYRRWSKLGMRDIRHPKACVDRRAMEHRNGRNEDDDAIYGTATASDPRIVLDADEWTTFKAIIDAATAAGQHEWCVRSGEFFGWHLRRHVATCKWCGEHATKHSVLVRVTWADRPLSREYTL